MATESIKFRKIGNTYYKQAIMKENSEEVLNLVENAIYYYK